jgi:hypothetical protein
MPGLTGTYPAGTFGNGAHFPAFAGKKSEKAVSLAPICMAEDDSFNTERAGFTHDR